MRQNPWIFSFTSSVLIPLIGFGSPCLSACSAAGNADAQVDESASAGGGTYYLVPLDQPDAGLEFIGQGSYEDSVDRLTGSYKTQIEQRFSDHVQANGGNESCGDIYDEPRYRAYKEDGVQVAKIAQYYKRGKLILDRNTQQIYRVMLGRRFAGSNAFANDTQVGGCDATQAAQAFSEYALFNASAKGLGNPVSEPFCLPDESGASVLNPNAALPRIPAQYFDYGRLEFRNGQVELADLGFAAFLQDETSMDPGFAFMDSGFIKVNGQPLQAGTPMLVARSEPEEVNPTIAWLNQNPAAALGITLATPVLAYAAVNPAPTPEKIPLGVYLAVAGLLVLGGAVYLLVQRLAAPSDSYLTPMQTTYASQEWQAMVQRFNAAVSEMSIHAANGDVDLENSDDQSMVKRMRRAIEALGPLLARLQACNNDQICIIEVMDELLALLKEIQALFLSMQKIIDAEIFPEKVVEFLQEILAAVCEALGIAATAIRQAMIDQSAIELTFGQEFPGYEGNNPLEQIGLVLEQGCAQYLPEDED